MRVSTLMWFSLAILSIFIHHFQSTHAAVLVQETIAFRQIGPSINSTAGIAAVNQLTGFTDVAVSSSAPILTIGVAVFQSGADSTLVAADTYSPALLQFCVDYTNSHGGLWVNGVQYQVSIVYADHQSSTYYMQTIYNVLASQGAQIFLGPLNDEMQQSLNQLIAGLNVSVVTNMAWVPSTYEMGLTNLFGVRPTADLFHLNTLAAINDAAQKYAMTEVGVGESPFGIRTVCLFNHGDIMSVALRMGILDWIDRENASRMRISSTAPPIILVTNATLGTNVNLPYEDFWLSCPDNTDLAIMPMNTASVAALDSSGRRFKAVMNLLSGADVTIQSSDQVATEAGWINSVQYASFSSNVTTQPINYQVPYPPLFKIPTMYSAYQQAAGLPSLAQAGFYAVSRITQFGFAMFALNASLSYAPSDFRTGLLSLNGDHPQLGTVPFNQTTGVNIVSATGIGLMAQCQLDGSLRGFADGIGIKSTLPLYPYNWLWPRARYGYLVRFDQSTTPIIIGFCIAFIGAWSGALTLSHAIQIKQAKSSSVSASRLRPLMWLVLSSDTMGAIGAMCAQIMMSSGLKAYSPANGETLSFAWSSPLLFVTWIVLTVLMGIGHFCLVHDTWRPWAKRAAPVVAVDCESVANAESPPTKSLGQPKQSTSGVHKLTSKDSITQSTNKASVNTSNNKQSIVQSTNQPTDAGKSIEISAALTWPREFQSVLMCLLKPVVLVAGVFCTASLIVSRVLVMQAWRMTVYTELSGAGWAKSIIVDCIMMTLSICAIRYGSKLRLPGMVLFAATVLVDWIMSCSELQMFYDDTPTCGVLYSITFSSTLLTLIAGFFVAIICFIFIGVQFFRMQLSHKGLLVFVLQKDRLIKSTNEQSDLNERCLIDCRAQHSALVAAIDSINLLTSSPQEFALPLAVFNSIQSTGILHRKASQSWMFDQSPMPTQTANGGGDQVMSPPRSTLRGLKADGQDIQPNGLKSNSRIHPSPSPNGSNNQSNNQSRTQVNAARFTISERAEELMISSLESQAFELINQPNNQTNNQFSLLSNLLGDSAVLVGHLTLSQVLSHPVCIELFKRELSGSNSLIHLMFWLHVKKYQSISLPKLRRLVACHIAETFIVEKAPYRLTLLSPSQISAIHQIVNQKKDDLFTRDLFRDAENECMQVMEMQYQTFNQTINYRVCCWLYAVIDVNQIAATWMLNTHRSQVQTNGESHTPGMVTVD